MFAGPPELSAAWSDSGAEGVYRFLKRLYTYAVSAKNASNSPLIGGFENLSADTKKLRFEIHTILAQANHDYERLQYNTVVSAAMKILNALDSAKALEGKGADAVRHEGLSILLRVLYPIAPHITWQLWRDLGFAAANGDLLDTTWPETDGEALKQDEVQLMIQINGKLRGQINVPHDSDKAAIEAMVLADASVAKHTEGATIKKIVIVPGRLINVVI